MDWLALVVPPLIWVNAAWVSAVLKTYRHGLSGAMSIVAGGLMFAALKVDEPAFPVVLGLSALTMVGMFTALFWPPRIANAKQKARRRL